MKKKRFQKIYIENQCNHVTSAAVSVSPSTGKNMMSVD